MKKVTILFFKFVESVDKYEGVDKYDTKQTTLTWLERLCWTNGEGKDLRLN